MCDPGGKSQQPDSICHPMYEGYSLGGVGLVVHEEEIQVADVVDEEGLVAGRHHVAGLAVVTISDLCAQSSISICPAVYPHCPLLRPISSRPSSSSARSRAAPVLTHLWHGSLALEASPDSVVDTLGLSPAGVHAHEPVTLVTAEARGVLLDDWHMLLCGNHLCCVDGG